MNPNEVWKFRKARGNFINIYFFITHPNRDLEPKDGGAGHTTWRIENE